MRYTVLLTGSGGQGVMSAGMTLAKSAAGLAEATFVPWYGAAQRGGVAKCIVTVSDKPIMSPLPGKCKAMIAMNDDACQKGLDEIKDGALVIRNINRGAKKINADVILIDVPADDMAREAGDPRMMNMVLTGVLLGYLDLIPLEVVEESVIGKLAAKNPEAAEITKKAMRAGFEWGADATHLKEVEAKPQTDAKYNIDKMTVGEILDTPELRAIVERLFPQLLNHPLLNAGRMFKFLDALPYMKDMLKDGDVDRFREEVENLS